MSGKNSVRVAVIGTGRIGQLHIKNIIRHIPEAELIAIADVNSSSIERIAQRFAIATVSTNYHELLDRSDIEAVVVCSSSYSWSGELICSCILFVMCDGDCQYCS